MDTISVRRFVLTADKLNISAAGREMEMAPAVASSRLAKLEKTLGAALHCTTLARVPAFVFGHPVRLATHWMHREAFYNPEFLKRI